MQVKRYKVLLRCLLLFTPILSVADTTIQLTISDPTAQYVWDEAYASYTDPVNTYATEFIYQDYNAFWPDPTGAFRTMQYVNPSSTYALAMLGIVYFPDADIISEAKKKKRPPIAEYSLHWPVMLQHYYQFTDDEPYVREMATNILPKVMEYFENRMTHKGLLRSPGSWPAPLRRGIDYEAMVKTEDAISNAFYYRALVASGDLYQQLGLDPSEWREKAQKLKNVYHEAFGHKSQRLFVDSIKSTNTSVTTNALALCFGLTPESAYPETIDLIRKSGINCAPSLTPYIIEACFIAQEPRLAIDLLSFMHDYIHNPEPLYLIPRYVFGAYPDTPGWSTVGISPNIPDHIESGTLRIPILSGKISINYAANAGIDVTIPIQSKALVDNTEGMNVVIKKYKSHSGEDTLSPEHLAILENSNRKAWVGDDTVVWIDIDTQMLRVIQGNTILYQARCASAANGVGSQRNSLKTPKGWHSIERKVGDDAPWGQVFRSRIATKEIWLPGKDTTEDLVLTRVLLLTGEEPGLNKGGQVDSLTRHIYIHGTNDEARIGIPSSHGCIRMTNDDVIDVYEILTPGMMVLITASDET